MRNDSFDEVEHIPSLRTEVRGLDSRHAAPDEAPPARRAGNGFLWALVVALALALGGLGWWSQQRLALMEQQLVATQESFARISEDAALRIQNISGKVVAAESSATTGSESLKLQIRQLEGRLAEQDKRQQALQARQEEQDLRLGQLAGDLQKQQGLAVELVAQLDGRLRQLDERLQALVGEQAALKSQQTDQEQRLAERLGGLAGEVAALKEQQAGQEQRLGARLNGLDGEMAALKKRSDPAPAIGRLEQELLVLRSELDNRPTPRSGVADTAEFDAFRAQTTRSFTALQSQMRSLQQQLHGR
ncbi:ATPase [Azotobacter chroococcum]|nr:ATPase [Azotobacter chroococcum]TBV91356.1 ATPase [Azotobacter chroococcum]